MAWFDSFFFLNKIIKVYSPFAQNGSIAHNFLEYENLLFAKLINW